MHGWRAITMPAVVFKTKVLLFKIENTPMKETNWKRKFKRMPSFFVNKGTVFVSKLSFEEINLVFFAAKLFTCFEPTKAIKVPKKLKVILYSMVKEITFLKGNLCIYEGFMDVLYILRSAWKKNLKMSLVLKLILCWILPCTQQI